MNTTENNKLIAEFMGLKDSRINDTRNGIIWETQTKGLKYHASWKWLMPVIQKCYDIISPMLDTGENHKNENLIGDITLELLDGRLTECRDAVVAAIKYYNLKN